MAENACLSIGSYLERKATRLLKELGLREKELATMAERALAARTEAEKRVEVNKRQWPQQLPRQPSRPSKRTPISARKPWLRLVP